MLIQEVPPGAFPDIAGPVQVDAPSYWVWSQHAQPGNEIVFIAEVLDQGDGRFTTLRGLEIFHAVGAVGEAVDFKFR